MHNSSPTVAPKPTVKPTVTPTVASSPTPTAGVVTATSRVTGTWPRSYCAAVTVSTTGARVTSWSASLRVSGHVYSVWGALWSQSGTTLTLRNQSGNGVLTKSAPVTNVGYCAATS